jgi:vacuolar-type H+-ATPase subunit C/Vma6
MTTYDYIVKEVKKMSKLNLSKSDEENLIKWLKYADKHIGETMDNSPECDKDYWIDKHWEIDNLIKKLEI